MNKEEIAEILKQTPFSPHPALRNGHMQTIASSLIRRRVKLLARNTKPRFFDVTPGGRVLAHCSWQNDPEGKPTLLILHGLEGSADSGYMLGTAEKALAAGFNAIRLNMRNCGGTEHLSPSLYHAGLTDDLRQVIAELIEGDGLKELYPVGFSLGGNVVLKLAGEYGDEIPQAVRAVTAISPSLDLASCADAMELRSNLLYHHVFLRSLKSSFRRKARLFPDRYDASRLRGIWSIRSFDDVCTAPLSGFLDVADYYKRASALPLMRRVAVPTLIIHAKDDPFIPFASFERPEVGRNPQVILLAPEQGGHVGFITSYPEGKGRYWAETKALEFVTIEANMG